MAGTLIVGPLQIEVPIPPGVNLDPGYLTQVISADWVEVGNDPPIPPGDLNYWLGKATTPEVFSDGYVHVGWNGYWKARMAPDNDGSADPRLAGSEGILGKAEDFGFLPETDDTEGPLGKAIPLYEKAQKGITPQLGLLEDDILYNLSLLCVNLLQPLKDKYPNIVVVSGFRQVNNGISQHEKGEAVDIRLSNQTPELLYEVADYVAKNLPFDQLVLNYSPRNNLSWIHLSFTSTTLRREVLTRDLDDTFHEGLYLITELTGEARAAAQREQAEYLTLIDNELNILATRTEKLTTTVVLGDKPGPVPAPTKCTGPSGTVPDVRTQVAILFNGKSWNFVADYEDRTASATACGLFIEAVVQTLKKIDPQWGYIIAQGVERQYNGHLVDAIAYRGVIGDPDGAQYNGKQVTRVDILIDSLSDTPTVGWTVNTPCLDRTLWKAGENTPDVPNPGTPSQSPSASASPSASLSPSASVSLSMSPSASASPSASQSPSASVSPSSSTSPSRSPSASISPSASVSPSSSASSSTSPSASKSPSASVSPSSSSSPSMSPSSTPSRSVSPSASSSPSPS
jgi:hypothetical protein